MTPVSVMYKRYNAENRALRIGLDLSLNISNTDGNALPNDNYSDASTLAVSLLIGKEFQEALGGRWMWYYGADLAPTFARQHLGFFANDQKTGSQTITGYGLSLRPFIGIRFNINSRIYLAAEANASLAYSVNNTLQKNYNPGETVKDLKTSNVNFGLDPASGIFIFYRF